MLAAPPRQLPLDLALPERMGRDDFLDSDANGDALDLIERWPDWPDKALVLVGPAGCGKSHLAAIWAETAGARFLAGHALDVTGVPAALATGALVLEDIEPGRIDGGALFHLLNLVRQQNAFLLMTAESPPANWALDPPDALSRLRAVPVARINPPDDALLRAVLVKLFADRQITIDETLVSFLVQRIERSFSAAREAVERLDREALARRRAVNRALAAELWRDQGDLFGD